MTSTITAKPVKRSVKAQTRRRAGPSLVKVKDLKNDGLKKEGLTEDERWQQDIAALRRAAAELALRRNDPAKPVRKADVDAPLHQMAVPPEDPWTTFRKMSVRDLYDLDPERAVSLFNNALRKASLEQREEIGAALAASGVGDDAIKNLMEGNRENSYSELSLLFLVAKLREDERWQQDIAALRRAAAELALRRNDPAKPVRKADVDAPLHRMAVPPEDPWTTFRKMSVRDLYDRDPERAVSLFNNALRKASLEQREEIGAALAASGVVDDAIKNLMEGNRENSYSELSLLFLVAKAGKVHPLIRMIEEHPDMHLRLAVVRLLASSGAPEVLSVFRRLAQRRSLAMGVQLALLEAINQISGPTTIIPAWAGTPDQHSSAQSGFTG